MGLMQLMPGTWLETKAKLGLGSDPFNPRDNILAGTAYLRMMYDRFGYPGLFAAYNAGPARYTAYLAGARKLPVETRAYVSSVAGEGHPMPISATPPASIFAVHPGATGRPYVAEKSAAAPPPGLFFKLENDDR